MSGRAAQTPLSRRRLDFAPADALAELSIQNMSGNQPMRFVRSWQYSYHNFE
jgi:hypothetical protein